ncbi:hypothetical protein NMY22_g2293 [Coprinellus aureogranulatus]|nr:hypothetical protein NMY22_g2293 [Coprinellus aureogranulatus]
MVDASNLYDHTQRVLEDEVKAIYSRSIQSAYSSSQLPYREFEVPLGDMKSPIPLCESREKAMVREKSLPSSPLSQRRAVRPTAALPSSRAPDPMDSLALIALLEAWTAASAVKFWHAALASLPLAFSLVPQLAASNSVMVLGSQG